MGEDVDSRAVERQLARIGAPRTRILRLSDYRTYGRMYVHILGTIATWARDAGHRGLLLLFDEVEGVDGLDAIGAHHALQVLKHFAAVTVAPGDLAFDPNDGHELYRGGHSVHRHLDLRFRQDQPLSVVFSLTPLAEIQEDFEDIVAGPGYDIHLGTMGRKLVETLVLNIADLYSRAYPAYPLEDAALGEICGEVRAALDEGHGGTRDLVRGTVFHLDRLRLRTGPPRGP
jgi:hypothetical protein